MNTAEDMAMMLNMGFSLSEVAEHTGVPLALVVQLIVTHVKAERIKARLSAFARS